MAAAAAGASFVACEAFGGHPNGDGAAVVQAPRFMCLGTCVDDPGSAAVSSDECQAAASLETLPIVSFDDGSQSGTTVVAEATYSYTDGTARLFFEYSAQGASGFSYATDGWQPPTRIDDFCGRQEMDPVDRANPPPDNYVLHVLGGYIPGTDRGPDSCGDPTTSIAAPFRGYGGGIGISMQKLNNRDAHNGDDNNRQYCAQGGSGFPTSPDGNTNLGPGTRPDVCPPDDAEYAVRIAALDVSAYDGVSFWARRGPNGQSGLHVLVGDENTDDDLSYLTYYHDGPDAPRHCERVRQCSCANHRDCEYVGDAGPCQYAGGCTNPPLYDLAGPDQLGLSIPPTSNDPGGPGYYCQPFDRLAANTVSLNGQGSTSICSPLGMAVTDPNTATLCNMPWPAYPNNLPDGGYNGRSCTGQTTTAGLGGDPQFWGRPCTPYTFQNGTTAAYCFDPTADPPPADSTQWCGDHWTSTVDLGTDWRFYKVPFTDMRQQGWAKKSLHIDLHAVSVVRFTWDPGWVDFSLDEVAFYKEPK